MKYKIVIRWYQNRRMFIEGVHMVEIESGFSGKGLVSAKRYLNTMDTANIDGMIRQNLIMVDRNVYQSK